VSLTLATNPLFSGDSTFVAVQLTAAAPAGGASIPLSSSNPSAAAVPTAVAMPGNIAWTQFQLQAGQVTVATSVTISATLNGGTASVQFSVLPPSLKSLTLSPSMISGGATAEAIVMLNGQAPAGGAVVGLSSSSPSASPPATATVAPGSFSASVPIPTSRVTSNTLVTITASWNGVTAQAQITLTPQLPPTSLTLSPTSVEGGGGSFGTVTIGSPAPSDEILQLASSNPAVASVNNGVMIPAGMTTGGFNIFTTVVTAQTVVIISVSGGGVTLAASLTVTPPPPPAPGDTVRISKCAYDPDNKVLSIEATSTSSSATLRAYVTSTNTLIGTLTNNGGGRYSRQFSWPSNPGNVTVKSSLGGSASCSVVVSG